MSTNRVAATTNHKRPARAAAAVALAAVLLGSWAARGATLDLEQATIGRRPLPKSYRLEFQVRGTPNGLAALINCHSRENYAFLYFDGTNATLYEVVDGKRRRLPVSLRIASEGTLFVRPGRALLRLGARQAAADLAGPPGGRYAWVGGTFEALTVRRSGALYFADDFMREKDTGEHWRPVAGRWAVRYESDTSRSANPFRCIARADGVGLMTTGEPHWHAYRAAVSVRARGGSAGLAFALRDERNYHLFRLAVGAGASELVRVRDGDEHVLARTNQVLYPDQWYRLRVRTDGEGIACSVGGKQLLRSTQVAAVGKIGLYVRDTEETLFDDTLVKSSHLRSPAMPTVRLFSKTFESDRQMENWASLLSSWRACRIDGPGGVREFFWHKGEFFGDVSIGYSPAEVDAGGSLLLAVGGDGREPGAGARLRVRRTGDGSAWTLTLGGKELASEQAGPLAGSRVTLRKTGDRLVAARDGTAVIETDPVELPGRAVGLGAGGLRLDLHKVTIRSPHVHDYLFKEAPIEWFARTGTWTITNRWECDPRWSWLGGRSDHVAQMWSRRAFHGDQVVEFFAALKMQKGRARYPHVGDINLTICGDGRNLDSGYQVVFAGWGNRWTRLLRAGQIVAGSGDHVIRGNFHRRWFHIKVRRAGPLVQLFLDGRLVRQFRDPKPLAGGHIALWTVDNAVMIARVRVYAERSSLASFLKDGTRPAIELRPPEEPPDGHLVRTRFDRTLGGWEPLGGRQGAALRPQPGGGLMAVNRNAGGSFGVALRRRPFDLLRYPVVRLAWQTASAEPVRLNLFVRVNGRLLELPLAAPAEPTVAATLAAGPEVSFHGKPGAEHQVELDLGARVAAWYEKRLRRKPERLTASELFLANASNRDYLLCGFGGNRAGARVLFTEFAIQARP
ncbi:MAG: hypothetical protein R6V58_04735 [Planctomycetota bacterium]